MRSNSGARSTWTRNEATLLVFSGGVTAPVPVVAGRSVTFEFDGLGAIEVFGTH
jgi:2-keto-4-pentenoate hydratase